MPTKKRKDQSAPTSIRLSQQIKDDLRQEAKMEKREMGGPPRSLHFMIVTAVREWLEQRQKRRQEPVSQ